MKRGVAMRILRMNISTDSNVCSHRFGATLPSRFVQARCAKMISFVNVIASGDNYSRLLQATFYEVP